VSMLGADALDVKTKLFRGFAEASRLLIVEALLDGEKTVTEICAATGLTQPNASNHLACLVGCRLVDRDPRGRYAYFRLADERVGALLTLAEQIGGGLGAGEACCPVCGSGP